MKCTLYAVPAMLCLTAAIVTAQAPAGDKPAAEKPAAQQPAHAFNATGARGVGGHEQGDLHRLREARYRRGRMDSRERRSGREAWRVAQHGWHLGNVEDDSESQSGC